MNSFYLSFQTAPCMYHHCVMWAKALSKTITHCFGKRSIRLLRHIKFLKTEDLQQKCFKVSISVRMLHNDSSKPTGRYLNGETLGSFKFQCTMQW